MHKHQSSINEKKIFFQVKCGAIEVNETTESNETFSKSFYAGFKVRSSIASGYYKIEGTLHTQLQMRNNKINFEIFSHFCK